LSTEHGRKAGDTAAPKWSARRRSLWWHWPSTISGPIDSKASAPQTRLDHHGLGAVSRAAG
jgi:hypothetical protein